MSQTPNGSFTHEADQLFEGKPSINASEIKIPPHPHGAEWQDAERNRDLCTVLLAISKKSSLNESDVEQVIHFFVDLYGDGTFRHKYSAITAAMLGECRQDESHETSMPTAMYILVDNIDNLIVESAGRRNVPDETIASLKKLSDHISLEIQRIDYLAYQYDSYSKSIAELNKNLSTKLKKTRKQLNSLKNDADSMQRDYIAILGIFAAVVLVTNGGISLTTSSIAGAANLGVGGIGFVVTLVGAVMFNTFYALLTFVSRLTKRGSNNFELIGRCPFIIINVIFLILGIVMLLVTLVITFATNATNGMPTAT